MQEREQVIEGFRLSPQQKQIWELQKDGEAYHSQVAVLIEGDFESRALDEALKKIRRKHDVLRTALDWLPGLDTPIQMIQEDSGPPCRKIDLSDRSVEERERALEELLREEARPFELKRGRLMRCCLVRLSASRRILVISLHALCADSWTLRNLFREVGRFYAAELEGRELTEEAVQYLQFSEWQHELLEELNEEIEGREQEADRSDPDLILPLELDPAGASKLQRHHFAPEFITLRFDSPMARRIEAVSNACHSPVSGFLLACWQILLWRLSAKEEILTEYLFDGRPFEKLHDALGLFAGYLPVRGTFGHDPRFDEAVERALKSLDHAFELREFSLREMASGRARNRVQAIGFEYEEWPEPQSAGPAKFTYWRQRSCIGRFKLKLGVYRTANGLTVELQYDSALFSQESVGLIGERYLRLVESAASDRKALIRDLQIIGQRELETLLDAWNKTEQRLTVLRPIHDLIGEQARLRPESIAVIYRDEQLCYLELEIRANRLAHHLRAQGVGPDCVVGLYLARSTEMMVGLFGILKAGGAYLPLEIGLPAERLASMLEDSGARIVITKQDMAGSLPPGRYRTVLLDGERERLAEYSQMAPELELSPENLAYVIYTSGSTGKPKGVMVRHGSVVNLLEGLERAIYEGESEDLTVSVNASLSFDASVKQLIQLGRGRRLCVVPEAERRDAEAMLEYLKINRVEALDCTPSQWGALLEAGLRRGDGNPRIVLVGGEAIDSRDWREMAESRGVKYHNVYGPTECTVDAMTCVVGEMREPSLGRPISNTSIYILDENGGVAPVGMVGEICIGGAGLAQGYIREAGMTAEKFVPSPYGKREGERLYRTGDLGRYLEDGRVVYEGRRDDQVKVRGYRIELGEIETVLKSYPGIREAVATVKADELGQKQLVGYVVKRREKIVGAGQWEESSVTELEEWITEERLKNYAREKLPDYMVPSAVMIIDALPLTRNGKVDREALPGPEAVNTLTEMEEGGHQSAYEEVIDGIWKEVLKVARIRRRDNFFEIGGHSLSATQVISRIRKAFGVEIAVRSIFEEPTVAGLARRIEGMMRAGEREAAPPLVRVDRRGVRLPLSFAQQRLWFLDQLAPNDPSYNIPGAVRLDGSLDLKALERAIDEIVRRHEVLRTRIEATEGEPAQVVEAWEPRRLEVIDLSQWTPEEREEEVRRLAQQEARTGFNLASGPLLRTKALKVGEERHVLLFTMHHIVSDGWSMGILIREVGALYRAYLAGEDSPLPELEIQYADYAIWQRRYLAGGVLEREVEYWKAQLKDAAVLELPTDHPRPAAPTYRGGVESIRLGKEVSEELKRLSRREGATLFMVLMAAFKTLLMRHGGEEDLSVGTAIANRTRGEIEGLIGFFVNTLVMRTSLAGNPTFRELIGREREAAFGAYAHQNAPFEKLVEEINPERDLSRSPLFQVMMVLQNARREQLEFSGLKVSGIGEETAAAKFDLTLTLSEGPDGIAGILVYSRDIYEAETVRRMARRFERVVGALVTNTEQRIQEVSLMNEAERRQVIEEWNQTEREYGELQLVHEMIAKQANSRPDAIAVKHERGELSYGELNRRANRLGRYLQGLGVGPEVVVGVCLERSAEIVVAVMGALKAGGAYLPLDPESPPERLRRLLQDSGVGVLVTQQKLQERLSRSSGKMCGKTAVLIDAEWDRIAEQSDSELETAVVAENLAYIIYTSGSTGKPKGVMVTHGGLGNYLRWARESYEIAAGEGAPVQSSIGFDLTVTSLYGPLVSGKSVRLLSEDEGIEALGKALREGEGYSLLKITPAHLEILQEQLRETKIAGQVRALVIGGEELKSGSLKFWRERAAETRLINEYGPTETVVGCCVYEAGESLESGESVPIGRPIANTRMYALDEEREPAPVGARGEIYIAGAGVARGYLGRPELTAERFVPDQYGRGGGERAYRTGDIGKYRADGNLEFLGRGDGQVKIRSHRIELGEIEAALNEHEGVRQSVVVAKDYERGGKRLAAYVVADAPGANAAELKRRLREKLPAYMVPEAIVMLDEMPLTANGKIDRAALGKLAPSSPVLTEEYVAPRDVLEFGIMKIWEEVLAVRPIGVRDNFFSLGGHSLSAVSLKARIEKTFHRELPLSTLFQNGTIEQQARMLRQQPLPQSWSPLVGIKTSGSRSPFFCAHPVGGNVLCYSALAQHFDQEQPFYGLQSMNWHEEADLPASFEETAARYIEAIREKQPHGPYFLGGWSLGGVLAFEMARQLQSQGQPVALLALMDSWAPVEENKKRVEHDDARLLADLARAHNISLPRDGAVGRLSSEDLIKYAAEQAEKEQVLPEGVGTRWIRQLLRLHQQSITDLLSYRPKIYAGQITLFSAKRNASTDVPPDDLGWGRLSTQPVDIYVAQGDHHSMLSDPHAQTLARQLNDCLKARGIIDRPEHLRDDARAISLNAHNH